MPKGLIPKKRRLRKQMKPIKKASRLVNQMLASSTRLGMSKKALEIALKKPGTMKKIKSFLQPMSKGRGK